MPDEDVPTKKSTSKRAAPRKKAAGRRPVKATSKAGGARPARRPARRSRATPGPFPERIFAIASPISLGGVSMFEPGVMAHSGTVGNFVSMGEVVDRSMRMLAEAGFEVLHANSLMINIAGPRELYESTFGTSLVAVERPTMKQRGLADTATYFDTTDTDVQGLISTSGTRFEGVLEGVAIEEPAYLATPTMFPPPRSYWHLDVPADVSLGCNADRAHRTSVTGRDVRVAMVDTGWQSHPFFTERGYRVDPVVLGPGTADPAIDEVGHGTGESANVFATAPDARLMPVKAALSSGALVNMTAAFNAAVALNPNIITNSWTSSIQFGPLSAAMQARAAAVAAAVAAGIVVVFAAGNGHWGFPGQHPDVISAGGVFMNPDGTLRASDYTSGFMSNIYPGRRVPDLSGLVGMQPGAQYIMLPLGEGSQLDVSEAGGTHPNGDETATNDGWAAFSGTSAATPQIAGVCALIKQVCPGLTPADIKDILMTTARDVTVGTNHPNFGNAAVVGPDTATGNGLVDAHRAVLLAKLRCIVRPIGPFLPFLPPTFPLIPFQPPTFPLIPFQPPTFPLVPFQPTLPLVPFQPTLPLIPFQPIVPLIPFQPPILPFAPFGPPGPGALTAEDVAALERMIIESDRPPEL